MKLKMTNNWLIFSLRIFCVMGGFSLAQSSDASEIGPNFRQVALGMTVDEINSLESVTHGYMPKLTFIEKDKEKNVLVCKPLYFDVELLPYNHEIGWTDDAPKKSESRSSDKYSYELAPSGTFSCGEYFSYDMKLSLPLANFDFMVLSFWEGKLYRLSFGFSDSNPTGDGAISR